MNDIQKEATKKKLIAKLKAEKKKLAQRSNGVDGKQKRVVGEVNIPGVTKPGKLKPKPSKRANGSRENGASRATKPVATGPKGGQYVVSGSGKKQYVQSDKTRTFHKLNKSEDVVKETIDEIVKEDKYNKFVEDFKKAKSES